MQRLKDKIEKWFSGGIEYKWTTYDKYLIQKFLSNVLLINSNLFNKALSINDLCSPECSFLESLLRVKWLNIFDLNNVKNIMHIQNQNPNDIQLQYHRMQLSLLSDEDKILYLINNTK